MFDYLVFLDMLFDFKRNSWIREYTVNLQTNANNFLSEKNVKGKHI